jgi:hypothetical protein
MAANEVLRLPLMRLNWEVLRCLEEPLKESERVRPSKTPSFPEKWELFRFSAKILKNFKTLQA